VCNCCIPHWVGRWEVCTSDSTMVLHATTCFLCNVVFATKEALFHHIEVAYRYQLGGHLVLQEPRHQDIPARHRQQLVALEHFRRTMHSCAEDNGAEGYEIWFPSKVLELGAEDQRCLEKRVQPFNLPRSEHTEQIEIFPRGATKPVVFDPYLGCGANAYDFMPDERCDRPVCESRTGRHCQKRGRPVSDQDIFDGGNGGADDGADDMVRILLALFYWCMPLWHLP
jgi:hypothetical protein